MYITRQDMLMGWGEGGPTVSVLTSKFKNNELKTGPRLAHLN